MVDKFSQVAGNILVTNDDPNRRYTVINGYPVVLNFAKEPNPGVFERVRDILLATSYTKRPADIVDEDKRTRYTEGWQWYSGQSMNHYQSFFDNRISFILAFIAKVRNPL